MLSGCGFGFVGIESFFEFQYRCLQLCFISIGEGFLLAYLGKKFAVAHSQRKFSKPASNFLHIFKAMSAGSRCRSPNDQDLFFDRHRRVIVVASKFPKPLPFVQLREA